MNFISPELDIKLLKNVETQNHCIYFKFKGKFSEEASIAGSKSWGQYMDEKPNQKFEFVWDCEQMTGFELNARKEWYTAMQKYKDRIAMVYVIANGIMIRSAAKVMLEFFRIPSKISKSDEFLPASIKLD